MNKSESLALIEAIKELTKAIEGLKKQVPYTPLYTCVTCGKEINNGWSFGDGGAICDECYYMRIYPGGKPPKKRI